MGLVSAIIVINLAYVSCIGWNTFIPRKEVHRDLISGNIPVIYPNVTRRVIWQPVDHFNPNENRTFKARYDQSLDLWKPNGPIYIWILKDNFPSDEEFYICNNSLTYALAQETNGAMFVSQVRYFGESIPHVHKSDDDYFKYLNISQQLADIAGLIKYLKSKPEFESSKVVLLGWNRAANLATWMRVVYPDLVDAAVASSAPLLAKKDASEINEYTAYVYDHYGYKGCINEIEERFQWFKDALKNATELEFFKIKHDIFKDNNFTLIEDQQLYMALQHTVFRYYAYEGYLRGIEKCQYFRINGLLWDCHYDRFVKYLKKTYKVRADDYQSCLEYGQFETVSAKKQPFDGFVTLDHFLRTCKDVYGIDEKRMDEGIAQTNLMYGGLTPNVTNVVFTQGDLNPYKFLGVQQNLSELAPAFVIKNEGYINILYIGYVDENNANIINRVKTLIKKWIGM